MVNIGYTARNVDTSGNVYDARRRVNQAFLEALLEDFHQHGKEIIRRAGQEQPASYLKCLTQLVPKELTIETSQTLIGKLTDEQLANMIDTLDRQIAAALLKAKQPQPEAPKLLEQSTVEIPTVSESPVNPDQDLARQHEYPSNSSLGQKQ